jgi:hypothetical protein
MTITIDLKTGKVMRINPLRASPEELAKNFHGLFAADVEEDELRNVRDRLLMQLSQERVHVLNGRLTREVEGIFKDNEVEFHYGAPEIRRKATKERRATLLTPSHGMVYR